MKKGIMELSDLVIVNKSDGALVDSARYAQIEYTSALKFVKAITSFWKARVIRVSSMGGPEGGIDKAWDTMKEYFEIMEVIITLASCFLGNLDARHSNFGFQFRSVHSRQANCKRSVDISARSGCGVKCRPSSWIF